MANHPFVGSLGKPYFAFVAHNVESLSNSPIGVGLLSVRIVFRVSSLPTQKSSPDELHPLFSYEHETPGLPLIFEVGITPSGRLSGKAKDPLGTGTPFLSSGAIVLDSSRWYDVTWAYPGDGHWQIIGDGDTDTAILNPNPVQLQTDAGETGRFMLFNGREGLSRSAVDFRKCNVKLLGNFVNQVHYDFGETLDGATAPERGGLTLTPSVSSTAPPSSILPTAVATAGYFDPAQPAPWGATPLGSANDAYRWGIQTDYTRASRPSPQLVIAEADLTDAQVNTLIAAYLSDHLVFGELEAYRRKFPLEAVSANAKGVRSAGSSVQLTTPQATIDTGVGANKTWEIVEDLTFDPLEQTAAGESWWLKRHIVRGIVRNYPGNINPAGEQFIGVELGSFGVNPPYQTNWPSANSAIQLRWDFTNSRWEVCIFESSIGGPPDRFTCTQQPNFASPWVRELMIDYTPTVSIRFYIDALLAYTYAGSRMAGFAGSPPVGGGLFVTSGSNGAGRVQSLVSFNDFLTIDHRANSPD